MPKKGIDSFLSVRAARWFAAWEMNIFAERCHDFVAALEWEVCAANARDNDEVVTWLAARMGTVKRKNAFRAMSTACNLAGISVPVWAY